MRSRLLVLFSVVLCLQGCGSAPADKTSAPAQTLAQTRPALAEAVVKCDYLDDVASASGRHGILADQALEETRAEVMRKAAALGATHLVWGPPHLAQGSTTSSGKAYLCK